MASRTTTSAGSAPDLAGPPSATRILVIDGDTAAAATLCSRLAADGHGVEAVETGAEALRLLHAVAFDLVLLDAVLPDVSGFDLCRTIRGRYGLPVMFVSSLDAVSERIAGFEAGCDDYLTKPQDGAELVYRVRAVVRRAGAAQETPTLWRFLRGPGELMVNLPDHTASVGRQQLRFTRREFDVLALLLGRRGAIISKTEISRWIWGYEPRRSDNFVEVHVSRIRAKLAAAGATDVVQTVVGVGYLIP